MLFASAFAIYTCVQFSQIQTQQDRKGKEKHKRYAVHQNAYNLQMCTYYINSFGLKMYFFRPANHILFILQTSINRLTHFVCVCVSNIHYIRCYTLCQQQYWNGNWMAHINDVCTYSIQSYLVTSYIHIALPSFSIFNPVSLFHHPFRLINTTSFCFVFCRPQSPFLFLSNKIALTLKLIHSEHTFRHFA